MLLNSVWCWRWLLRVPWRTRRSNESILKEISPEYSLERLRLKLKLQYFGHFMRRTYSFEKTLMLEMIEGGRRRGHQRMRWLDGITTQWTWVWVSSRSWWWTGKPGCFSPWGHKWETELNWCTKLLQWCPTLCNPMECDLPVSSVHGILQRYCDKEQPWLHIECTPLTLVLCC